MQLGKTWAARGIDAEDPKSALADFRNIIRLGRLVRQDDVTILQDLVGVALIRMGADHIYDLAASRGDTKAMHSV